MKSAFSSHSPQTTSGSIRGARCQPQLHADEPRAKTVRVKKSANYNNDETQARDIGISPQEDRGSATGTRGKGSARRKQPGTSLLGKKNDSSHLQTEEKVYA